MSSSFNQTVAQSTNQGTKGELCPRCGDERYELRRKYDNALVLVCGNCKRRRDKAYMVKERLDPKGRKRAYDRYYKVRARVSKKGIPFTLTVDEFYGLYQAHACTYCGVPTDTISMDRIVPSEGYVFANIVMACLECNGFKSNYFTFDEMIKIGKVIGEVKKARLKLRVKSRL